MGKVEHVRHPFPPVFDENSKVLILGSFPSVISRQKSFYYANVNNRFWKVMAILFQEEIEDKKAFCLKHHIALWDVIQSCSINGSNDASITDVKVNAIHSLVEQTQIRTIFLTGKKAESLFKKYIHIQIETIGLPSTSSANAKMHLDDLVEAYHVILEKI